MSSLTSVTVIPQRYDGIFILFMKTYKGFQAHLHDPLCNRVPERFQGFVLRKSMLLCRIEVLQRLMVACGFTGCQTQQCSTQLAGVHSQKVSAARRLASGEIHDITMTLGSELPTLHNCVGIGEQFQELLKDCEPSSCISQTFRPTAYGAPPTVEANGTVHGLACHVPAVALIHADIGCFIWQLCQQAQCLTYHSGHQRCLIVHIECNQVLACNTAVSHQGIAARSR